MRYIQTPDHYVKQLNKYSYFLQKENKHHKTTILKIKIKLKKYKNSEKITWYVADMIRLIQEGRMSQ